MRDVQTKCVSAKEVSGANRAGVSKAILIVVLAMLVGACAPVKQKADVQLAVDRFHQRYDRDQYQEIWEDGSPLLKRDFDPLKMAFELQTNKRSYGKFLSMDSGIWSTRSSGKGELVTVTFQSTFEGATVKETFTYDIDAGGAKLAHYVSELASRETGSVASQQAAAPHTPATSAPSGTISRQFASIVEAQKEAVRRYPDLSVSGSRLNAEFLRRQKQYSQKSPAYFQNLAWPVLLADECSAELSKR